MAAVPQGSAGTDFDERFSLVYLSVLRDQKKKNSALTNGNRATPSSGGSWWADGATTVCRIDRRRKKNVEGQGERVKKKDPKIPPCDGLAVAGFTREEPPNKKHEQKTKSRHLKRGNDPEFVSGGHCWVADRVTSDSARKVLRFERHRETTPFFSFSASTRRRAEFYRMFLR